MVATSTMARATQPMATDTPTVLKDPEVMEPDRFS